MMRHQTANLPMTSFEVHAVYGLQFDIKNPKNWKTKFESLVAADGYNRQRYSWTPIYRNGDRSVVDEIDAAIPPITATLSAPKLWNELNSDCTPTPFAIACSRRLLIRSDGSAAMTIRLVAPRSQGLGDAQYNVEHILACLLLAPRMADGLHVRCGSAPCPEDVGKWQSELIYSRPNASLPGIPEPLWRGRGPLYALFLEGISSFVSRHENVLKWGEFDCATEARAGDNCRGAWPIPRAGDPQIPYFVVLADICPDQYSKMFMGASDEGQYSRDLAKCVAGILGRWLIPDNIRFISEDNLDAMQITRHGHLANKYASDLTFVTFGPSVTVCMRPSEADPEKIPQFALLPQEATYGSILRCAEMARLRWHNALRLSRQLDDLIERIAASQKTSEFIGFYNSLVELRSAAATRMLDPLSHLWDASVGSELAEYLQVNTIESIESECVEKLDSIKQLVVDKVDLIRMEAARHLSTQAGDDK